MKPRHARQIRAGILAARTSSTAASTQYKTLSDLAKKAYRQEDARLRLGAHWRAVAILRAARAAQEPAETSTHTRNPHQRRQTP